VCGGLGDDVVGRGVVGAAAAEHEVVHAHSHAASFALDALVNKHARPFDSVYPAWLRFDLACKSSQSKSHCERLQGKVDGSLLQHS